jgi:ligand-binding SRPBCC domain-containing protein
MEILEQEQFLPVTPEEAWQFFATPRNLARITPASLGFRITCEVPAQMYEGLKLTYRVKPLFGIPVTWWTTITAYEPFTRFVDVQTKGPYKTWIHQHIFIPVEGGVLMKDHVQYEIGYSFLGKIIGAFVVKPKLRQIFDYRRGVIENYFGKSA